MPRRIEEDERAERLLTAKDAGKLLRLSESWLAKARMRGDGPPYVKLGRVIRYREGALLQWLRSRQRLSTSEQQVVTDTNIGLLEEVTAPDH
jgi:predicted DNA-binding transcriptional regulator AlpA